LSAETPLSPRDPVEIMQEAYQYSTYVQGSSTCCIIVLDGTQIHAANLGDSGFMVIRGLEIVYRTKEQQHSFNFPYQIGTGSADKPQHSQRIHIEVQPDDLIILGTVFSIPSFPSFLPPSHTAHAHFARTRTHMAHRMAYGITCSTRISSTLLPMLHLIQQRSASSSRGKHTS
jgi:hypothetical protein